MNQAHLIHTLVSTRDHHPNYSLLLGAGCSVSSGVPAAGAMIREWRKKYREIYGEDDFIRKTEKESGEYSLLFEKLYDHPSLRREFIETCIDNASPSWGYIYLVNLIRHRCFNTIFTTNFDDLINDACYIHSSDTRPIVCAQDSSIKNVRLSQSRPKIIKLHGDFLFDSIKNTTRELDSLEDNMREKLKQNARDYGLIVIGYSGSDKSVMEPLEELLRDDSNFPGGVYWGIRCGSAASEAIDRLKRYPKFKVVDLEGFDEFCAELHHELNLTLQDEVADPYAALTVRLNSLVTEMELPIADRTRRIIEKDLAQLGERILATVTDLEMIKPADEGFVVRPRSISRSMKDLPVPYAFLGSVFVRQDKLPQAHSCIAAALSGRVTRADVKMATSVLRIDWNQTTAGILYNFLDTRADPDQINFVATDLALAAMHAGDFDFAGQCIDMSASNDSASGDDLVVSMINRAQIFLHKSEPVPEKYLKQCRAIVDDEEMPTMYHFGAAIILEDWEAAELALSLLVKDRAFDWLELPAWPITRLLLPNLQDDKLKYEMERSAQLLIRAPFGQARVASQKKLSIPSSRDAQNHSIRISETGATRPASS